MRLWPALAVAATLTCPGPVQAEEAGVKSENSGAVTDSEHIFGFTEGTDIGEKGEHEIEVTFVGSFGKVGRYANIFNESAFRYTWTDRLRLSVGVLSDFYSIHAVPGLANRTSTTISGIDAEARLSILDRRWAPIGLDIGVNPQWRHLDEVSGTDEQSVTMPTTLLVEKDILPGFLYSAVNLTYTPGVSRLPSGSISNVAGQWQHADAFEVSAAASAVVAPNVLVGGELRHLSLAENGTFRAQAFFAGPSFYTRLSDNFEAKIAWSAQISDISGSGLDLHSFDRNQVILLLSYTF